MLEPSTVDVDPDQDGMTITRWFQRMRYEASVASTSIITDEPCTSDIKCVNNCNDDDIYSDP